MNDYRLSPLNRTFSWQRYGVYYPDDDEIYGVEVEEVPPGSGGVFGAEYTIEDVVMSDCLFQHVDGPTPLPGCPPASVEKREVVRARRLDPSAAGAFGIDDSLYYDDEEEDIGPVGDDLVADVPRAWDYEPVLPEPQRPEYDFITAPAAALAQEAVSPDGSSGPAGDEMTEFHDGTGERDVAERLDDLRQEDPWFAGVQLVRSHLKYMHLCANIPVKICEAYSVATHSRPIGPHACSVTHRDHFADI